MAEIEKYSSLGSRFLDVVGDGSGSIHQNVNGAVTPVEFKLTCPEGYLYSLYRIILQLKDGGTIDADKYGNGLALVNGISMVVRRVTPTGIVDIPLTDQLPIRTNAQWGAYSYDVNLSSYGAGDQVLSVRYTFTNDGKSMRLGPGESLVIIIRDDLTGLSDQYIRVGFIEYEI